MIIISDMFMHMENVKSCFLKDAMSVSFKSKVFHLTFKPNSGSETYSRKYEKLSKIIIHACKNSTEKMNLLKMCGPQIRLCLFTFQPIAS